MSLRPDVIVELDVGDSLLDTAGRALLDTAGRPLLGWGWADVTADTRASVPISIRKGNFGNSLKDRVPDVGTLKLAFDNSQHNSAGLVGYYSPDHADCRAYFDEDVAIRVAFEYDAARKYKFQGRIVEIAPDTGLYGRRITMITAEDWFGEAAETPMVGLGIQVDQRDDELLDTLIGIFDNPPRETDFSVGEDVYPLAFSDELGESTKALSVLQKIALSGLSTLVMHGTATHGEKLVYRTRVDNNDAEQSVVATLDNSMVSMSPVRSRKKRVKAVRTTVYPNEIDASATTVLFSLEREIVLQAGESVTFKGVYIDPVSRKRIAGKDVVSPLVASTHYKFSSASGSGEDLNASLVIVDFSPYADQGEVTIRNDAAVTGYLWFMQWIGRGIYREKALEYTAENGVEKGVVLDYDMPYQDDYDVGVNIGDALMGFYAENETDVPEVKFIANRNDTLMGYFMDVETGGLVIVKEDLSGISSTYFVYGQDYTIYRQATRVDVLWSLVPAKIFDYFQLDSDDHGLDDANSGVLSY